MTDKSDDLVPWQEPGQDGQAWEEPQWDEPRAAADPGPHANGSGDWLTPAQLRSTVFRRAALGKRGLDEQQVNAFIDRVEQELTVLLQEKRALSAEVERLRAYVSTTEKPAPPEQKAEVEQAEPVQQAVSRVHEAHVYAASILSQAQQTADQYMREAQDYGRELVEDARRRRAELLARSADDGEDLEEIRAAARHYRDALRDQLKVVMGSLEEWDAAEITGPQAPPSAEPGQP
ncbi:MAG: DivIVA domain-containing protein [Nonomuraea sp.]|nr:DivIVA domain-containing protein [Nonomuraea sp.]